MPCCMQIDITEYIRTYVWYIYIYVYDQTLQQYTIDTITFWPHRNDVQRSYLNVSVCVCVRGGYNLYALQIVTYFGNMQLEPQNKKKPHK